MIEQIVCLDEELRLQPLPNSGNRARVANIDLVDGRSANAIASHKQWARDRGSLLVPVNHGLSCDVLLVTRRKVRQNGKHIVIQQCAKESVVGFHAWFDDRTERE